MAQPITIGANSIAKIGNCFFLIVEMEAKTFGVEIDPVFGVRTTIQQAASLIRAGVKRTKFQNTDPKPSSGTKVELKGVLFANGRIFKVFDVENATSDISVLVKINNAQARNLIRGGVRIIKVYRKPYQGHLFIDNIRDDGIWKDTKNAISKVSGVSLKILTDVASSYVKQKLGLHN